MISDWSGAGWPIDPADEVIESCAGAPVAPIALMTHSSASASVLEASQKPTPVNPYTHTDTHTLLAKQQKNVLVRLLPLNNRDKRPPRLPSTFAPRAAAQPEKITPSLYLSLSLSLFYQNFLFSFEFFQYLMNSTRTLLLKYLHFQYKKYTYKKYYFLIF